MTTELQNKAWSSLPKEFKKEVKRLYNIANKDMDELKVSYKLEYLFGIHNLTSDAEGEEMLTVSRKDVQKIYKESKHIVSNEAYGSKMYSMHLQIMCVLEDLFGSKCLPDETGNVASSDVASSKPKPAEPKFKVGDKAILKGYICTITCRVYEQGKFVGYKIESPQLHGNATVPESDLEPYTEPKETRKETKENANTFASDPDIFDMTDAKIVKPADFDNILADSFLEHNRLHIAAMAMQGLLNATSVERFTLRISPEAIAEAAFEYADALIKEAKKGGSK